MRELSGGSWGEDFLDSAPDLREGVTRVLGCLCPTAAHAPLRNTPTSGITTLPALAASLLASLAPQSFDTR